MRERLVAFLVCSHFFDHPADWFVQIRVQVNFSYLYQDVPYEEVSVDVAADSSDGREDDGHLGQVPVGREVAAAGALHLDQLLAHEVDGEQHKAEKEISVITNQKEFEQQLQHSCRLSGYCLFYFFPL